MLRVIYWQNKKIPNEKKYNDILIEFDATKLTDANANGILFNMSAILGDSGEIGKFELDIFTIEVKSLQTYEKGLIDVKKRKHYMEIA